MKKIVLISTSLILFIQIVNAQRLIALEHNGTTTLHAYLDSAIYYAADGDKLYLPGGLIYISPSSLSNGYLEIDKRLNIIGAGYNADSSKATGRTEIPAPMKLTIRASGGSLEGVYFNNPGGGFILDSINNFLITRCFINEGVNIIHQCYAIYIYETIIPSGIFANTTLNVVVEKCIIGSWPNRALDSNTGWIGGTFRNNIFFGGPGFLSYGMIYGVGSSVFENNIFGLNSSSSQFIGGGGNVFNNNIFTCDSIYLSGSNILNNNHFLQPLADIFQNDTLGQFNFTNDYHLKATSPGKNAGTDSTDIGVYGTIQPFKPGGVPTNPHILSKSIANITDANGNLIVNIKVKAQDH